MAFVRSKNIYTLLRSQQPKIEGSFVPKRGYITLGEREKALLAHDPALSQFKSHKKGARLARTVGDVMTIIIVAGGCYELYTRAMLRKEASKSK